MQANLIFVGERTSAFFRKHCGTLKNIVAHYQLVLFGEATISGGFRHFAEIKNKINLYINRHPWTGSTRYSDQGGPVAEPGGYFLEIIKAAKNSSMII